MTGTQRTPGPVDPSRRRALQTLAGGAGLVAGGAALAACTDGSSDAGRAGSGTTAASVTSTTARPIPGPPVDQRALIVVDLPGGNDSWSTLVPLGQGRYHDLRPSLALGPESVVPFADGYAINSYLRDVAAGFPVGVLVGVGVREPSLSHFDMIARWVHGTTGVPGTDRSGFLGRVSDALHAGDGFTGVSIGRIPSPALASRTPVTVGLPTGERLAPVPGADAQARAALDRSLTALSAGGRGGADRLALHQLDAVDSLLADLPPSPAPKPGALALVPTSFAGQVDLAVRLLQADVGIRVIHVSAAESAGYDTHDDHLERHGNLMRVLGLGLHDLLTRLDQAGLGDRVLVATTSEFGRRARENEGGLDHGAAGCSLLFGPVQRGIHGDHPSMTRLDADGNLRATVGFDRYYATLAAWLGVDPARVLPGRPAPLGGMVAT